MLFKKHILVLVIHSIKYNNRYYGIPKTVIWNYFRLCFICNLKLNQQSQSRIHPIISEKFLARFQLVRLS